MQTENSYCKVEDSQIACFDTAFRKSYIYIYIYCLCLSSSIIQK